MPITFLASLPNVSVNNGGTVTLTFSNFRNAANATVTLLEGDLVIVVQGHSSNADLAMPLPSGWSRVHEDYQALSTLNHTNLQLIYKFMGATPDTSVALTGNNNASSANNAVAFVFRGVDPTTPFDVTFSAASHAAKGTATAVPNPPAITPVTAGAFIVVAGAGSAGTGAAYTVPTGLSTTTNHFRSSNHAETWDVAVGVGIKTDWSSGAFDCPAFGGGNVNAANTWAAMVIALRPLIPTGWADVSWAMLDATETTSTDVTGTLTATETGADTAAIVAETGVEGTAAATEVGEDVAAIVAAVTSEGTFSATETGADTAAILAAVEYAGTLAAAETGDDTAVVIGEITITGTLDATETGADAVFIVGTVPLDITGTLTTTEAGDDTTSILAQVTYEGNLAATEAGDDTAAILASVNYTGTLSATETGADTAAILAAVNYTGTLVATEVGDDTAAILAQVVITGSLEATEAGADAAALIGVVAAPVTGTLEATEAGDDTASILGSMGFAGTLAAVETGDDTAAIVAAVYVQGALAATETGADTASILAAVSVSGTLVVTESGLDVATITGSVAPAGIAGVLAATELGDDTAGFTGAVAYTGSLAATETGADTASITGTLPAVDRPEADAPPERGRRHGGTTWVAQQAIAANIRREKERTAPSDYSKPEEPPEIDPELPPPTATVIPFPMPPTTLPVQVMETAVPLTVSPEEDMGYDEEQEVAMLLSMII